MKKYQFFAANVSKLHLRFIATALLFLFTYGITVVHASTVRTKLVSHVSQITMRNIVIVS